MMATGPSHTTPQIKIAFAAAAKRPFEVVASTRGTPARTLPAERAEQSDQRRTQDDQGERHFQKSDRDEGRDCHRDHPPSHQRSPADPEQRLGHDRQHRGLQPEEQALDQGKMSEAEIGNAERQHHNEAGKHEERSGSDAAPHPVHQPADIGGKLLRLGPWQEHAVVQRMEEPLLVDPAFLLDEHAVHQRDLAGGAAEIDEPDLEPDQQRLAEGNVFREVRRRVGDFGDVPHVRRRDAGSANYASPRSRHGTSDRMHRRA